MASKYPVKGWIKGDFILAEDSDIAREFYARSRYGRIEEGRLWLSLYEGILLQEMGKLLILDGKQKEVHDVHRHLLKTKASKTRYAVFSDLRRKGYIVKTAMKFGADFRVYDKGVKPGQDHARWVVFAVHESNKHTWKDFSAKMRVAHSTRKRLLLAVVDDELDVTYWEASWFRP